MCEPEVDFIQPSISDFQTQFVRDFPFGDDSSHVTNTDIQNSLNEMINFINPDLFDTQAQYTLGALRLTAHYLVMNLRASSQGIWGSYPWMVTAKTVGSLKQTMEIPDRISKHPMFSMLTQTNYGAQYLYMVLPKLCGACFPSYGGTSY